MLRAVIVFAWMSRVATLRGKGESQRHCSDPEKTGQGAPNRTVGSTRKVAGTDISTSIPTTAIRSGRAERPGPASPGRTKGSATAPAHGGLTRSGARCPHAEKPTALPVENRTDASDEELA
jgi:hypothetical protein